MNLNSGFYNSNGRRIDAIAPKLTDSPQSKARDDDLSMEARRETLGSNPSVDENQRKDSGLGGSSTYEAGSIPAESSSDFKDEEGCYCSVRDPDEEVCDWCMDNRRKARLETLEAVENLVKNFDYSQYSDMGMASGNQEMLVEDLLSKLKGGQK